MHRKKDLGAEVSSVDPSSEQRSGLLLVYKGYGGALPLMKLRASSPRLMKPNLQMSIK